MKGVEHPNNFNSFLKLYWIELNRNREAVQEFEVKQEFVDQVLVFLNPGLFKKVLVQRSGVPQCLTPEEYIAARGGLPPLTIPGSKK